jgi:hypothetical protein
MDDSTFWKRCNTCKKPIGFAAPYCVCSVSTCNRPRTALVFCTIGCWDSHVPLLRHRDAWAIEKVSPTLAEWEREREEAAAQEAEAPSAPASHATSAQPHAAASGARDASASGGHHPAASGAPMAPAVRPSADAAPPAPLHLSTDVPHDILVVASKLKAYVRARSGMNTSDAVLEVLSDRLRTLCDQAIRRAADAGRKTVLDRDF